ncbi:MULTISPECIES: glycosyltransferase [Winogradskyella]|uniref:glycosyltransferase n=1 Tax=Winogradskyella TaxID=286104 RepID=UPI0015C998C2|nr:MULTISPECIES: glycosyltransferase [Winogradskyella]QXP79819.1 glycosyltransferase [Winogradskyella sp. HaHa_3_26]
MPQTTILIATSMRRTDWLVNRSLLSVYKQESVNSELVNVLIVDDNKEADEFFYIKKAIKNLRLKLNLSSNQFSTDIIRNTGVKFKSGTGAWNTGIKQTYLSFKNGFISILDDDDEYLPSHLSDCISEIEDNTVAVFQCLEWRNVDGSVMNFPLNLQKLTPKYFFEGNPGVQGSNMFFKTEALIAINGFDETLPNTTDRDLMIRFLWNNESRQIKVIENVGVLHYNHKQAKVNNIIFLKQQGLDLFYQKYMMYFSKEAYLKSLTRAKNYFSYVPIEER